ncbi:MAG: prolyl oligopeptidase family serine peptidase [Bacteroidales bacterium]|nr:prolyl oligopeptidase family serine peptidase [Bacteroidales bacterium]MDD4670376.1 prolyl oligopeptidase family serine peptidase [Bacteroidales bacterium]
MKTLNILLALIIALSPVMMSAQEENEYQRPPKAIENLILAPATPMVKISPSMDCFAILSYTDIPTIEEQAMDELRLAGIRVLASTNGPKVKTKIKKISIKYLPTVKTTNLQGDVKGFPENVNILDATWSPDGSKMVAFVESTDGIRLWSVNAATLEAKELNHTPINMFFSSRTCSWAPDGKSIAAAFIPSERGGEPTRESFKITPVIQSSEGVSNPAPTYQDLLTDKFTEKQFDYYATSKLGKIDINSGNIEYIGNSAIYSRVNYSPDGRYIMVQRISTPYSYVVPYTFFPTTTEVIALDSRKTTHIYMKPLTVNEFISNNSTSPYPREFGWRSDKPATLYWIEPLDGGNGRVKIEYRDRIMTMDEPFEKSSELAKTQYRFSDIFWGNSANAFIVMYDYATRTKKCIRFSPETGEELGTIYNTSRENLYADKGRIVMTTNHFGRSVVLSDDNFKSIYFSGNGYSPKGAYPFIDRYELKTGKNTRIWNSEDPYYEKPAEYINLAKGIFITTCESNTECPNYYLRNLKKKSKIQLTQFEDPYPEMKGVTMQVVEYTRKDGVKLSGTLYLPAGYKKENGRLPVLMWAYPSEYKDKNNAGQRSDAPNQFIRYTRLSPVLFVAAGYAVLNNASFPIIGEGDKEPNDTYIQQLVDNAAAAIDKLVDMGIADRDKIAVGGHSYGAFMTANLLANCDLFAAGIARSGAYNRTLTPFGFQNEMRTLWEAPEVYLEMSPFMKAPQLKTPILLIHGLADNNTGTFTMQSERLYTALKGNGGIVKLVLLPYESHGYVARESILHQAAETYNWLFKHVSNR